MSSHDEFRVVIPARFASTRLPGKPLHILAGKPMIQWVYELATSAGSAETIVATDDDRVASVVTSFGGRALMTRADHLSGTDRLAEVAEVCGWNAETIVVNLQGDEPCMPPELVRAAAQRLAAQPDAGIATLATPIHARADLFDPNIVKTILDERERALYFSRAPIPWLRGAAAFEPGSSADLPEGAVFLRHLGLYAYRVATLRALSRLAPAALEMAESLEQLRALWAGIVISVVVTQRTAGPGVDTMHDAARAEEWLLARSAAD